MGKINKKEREYKQKKDYPSSTCKTIFYTKNKHMIKYDLSDEFPKMSKSQKKYYESQIDTEYHEDEDIPFEKRILTYNQKEYGLDNQLLSPPVELKYYKNGQLNSILTNLSFNGLYSKTYTCFYKNGKIKKYVDMSWSGYDSEDDEIGLNGKPSGGIYMEFYDNGYKKCEGFFEYTYSDGIKSILRDELDIGDSYYNPKYGSEYDEGKEYYKCRLWIYYNKKGNIQHTEDHDGYSNSHFKEVCSSYELFSDKLVVNNYDRI